MTETLVSLTAIAVVAVIAPIIAEGIPRITLPVVVMEIILGILIGPQVLNLVHDDLAISSLSAMGLSFLFFLSGFELDFEKIRGRPLPWQCGRGFRLPEAGSSLQKLTLL